MNLDAFKASVERDIPPETVGLALQALWHAAKGDWETAHNVAVVIVFDLCLFEGDRLHGAGFCGQCTRRVVQFTRLSQPAALLGKFAKLW